MNLRSRIKRMNRVVAMRKEEEGACGAAAAPVVPGCCCWSGVDVVELLLTLCFVSLDVSSAGPATEGDMPVVVVVSAWTPLLTSSLLSRLLSAVFSFTLPSACSVSVNNLGVDGRTRGDIGARLAPFLSAGVEGVWPAPLVEVMGLVAGVELGVAGAANLISVVLILLSFLPTPVSISFCSSGLKSGRSSLLALLQVLHFQVADLIASFCFSGSV